MLDRRLVRYAASAALALVLARGGAVSASPAREATVADTLVPLAAPAFAPALTKPVIDDSGAYLHGAIVLAINTTAGYGVEGVSDTSGSGVFGYTPSTGNGVYGDSAGSGRGVIGISASGLGVEGVTGGAASYGGSFINTSSAASATAVHASAAGNALVASSTAGNGLVAYSGSGFNVSGVVGVATSDYEQGGSAGVAGEDNTTCSCLNYGVYGISNNNGYGVYGSSAASGSIYAVGVYADANDGAALYGAVNGSGSGTALRLTTSGAAGSKLITASVGGGADVMSLDDSGNLDLTGTLTQNGTPLLTGRGLEAQIENVGDARLVHGEAFVALDPAFAAHLDTAKPYHVFLTPNGESDGLYVASKTSTGFVVRENHRATSTLAFDYRVVATARHRVARQRTAPVRLPVHARLRT